MSILSKRYNIAAIFSAKDKISTPLQKIDRQYQTTFARVGKTMARMDRMSGKVLRAAGGVAAAGVAVLTAGVVKAGREFVEYEDALTQATAKFGPAVRENQELMDGLAQSARDIGATTEHTARQAADGLNYMAMAGMTAQESILMIGDVAALATAASTDFETATDIATDSLGAFGLAAGTAAEKQAQLARINDVFAATTTSANTDLLMLFETVKKGAATFTASGQSLESFSALAGVMANNGLKGAEAGTALRNIMLRLAGPTAEAQQVLDSLNITTQDSQGNFRDVVDILGDLEKSTAAMGTAQRTAALDTIFGARTVTSLNILLGEGAENLRNYRGELQESTGAAGKMAEIMRGSLGNRIKTLKSALMELGFQIVETFQADAASSLDKLTEAIRGFDVSGIVKGIEFFFKFLTKIIENKDAILGVAKAILGFALAIKTVTLMTKALNLLMTASPTGLIITAIAMAGLGAYSAVKVKRAQEQRELGMTDEEYEEFRKNRWKKQAEENSGQQAMINRYRKSMPGYEEDDSTAPSADNMINIRTPAQAAAIAERMRAQQAVRAQGEIIVHDPGNLVDIDEGNLPDIDLLMRKMDKLGMAQ